MKTNKFKIWHKLKQKWIDLPQTEDVHLIQDDEIEFDFNMEEIAIVQFIGLKDINEKEIYEEYIVKVIESTLSLGNTEIIGVIEYNENMAAYYINFPQYGESRPVSCFIETGIEIIGNEFEDNHLMENLIEAIKEITGEDI